MMGRRSCPQAGAPAGKIGTTGFCCPDAKRPERAECLSKEVARRGR
jgi:hypothetical protein